MSIKSRIIKKLEDETEYSAGHIELENLSEEDREKLFKRFGEGDNNLTEFLRQAYKSGLPSIFCCSGHGVRNAYVILKITDENIKLAQKIGKILSKQRISTNFTNDYVRGKYVTYYSINSASTDWLDTATQILEEPELFKDVEPDICYHEEMYPSYKPFLFDLKKRLLNYLRGTKKISEITTTNNLHKDTRKSWELSNEEKNNTFIGINHADDQKSNRTNEKEL